VYTLILMYVCFHFIVYCPILLVRNGQNKLMYDDQLELKEHLRMFL